MMFLRPTIPENAFYLFTISDRAIRDDALDAAFRAASDDSCDFPERPILWEYFAKNLKNDS